MLDRGFGAAGGWGRKGAEGTIVHEKGDRVVFMPDYGAQGRRREARMLFEQAEAGDRKGAERGRWREECSNDAGTRGELSWQEC